MTSAALSTGSVPAAAIRERLDWCALAVFTATLVQVLLAGHWYPAHRADPDLLAQLTFFRNWRVGDVAIWRMPYFTAPKPLLVFTLGALGDATLASYCSALGAAALSALVYLVCRDNFGSPTAALTSMAFLLDPSKTALAMKSGADLYLGGGLFLAIALCDRGRLFAAALSLLAAALIKPVALPCAAYVVIANPRDPRRWAAAAMPVLAVPLMLLGNEVFVGSALAGARFFGEFASMGGVPAIGAGEVIHFALWRQLIEARFLSTASVGLVGIALWIGDDRRRLLAPLLLLPLLFLGGYVGLALVAPFPPYFRYFWPLEVWFLAFVVFGAVEIGRRIADGRRSVASAATAAVLVLLADRFVTRAVDYHRVYAVPAEASIEFARAAGATLRARRAANETVLIPLGLLPFMAWELPEVTRELRLEIAERAARDGAALEPDWIVDIPGMYTSDRAREWMAALLRQRHYAVALQTAQAALLGPPEDAPSAERSGSD